MRYIALRAGIEPTSLALVRECFHLSECRCELRRRQNESLHVAIDLNENVLSDGKLIHTHRATTEYGTLG